MRCPWGPKPRIWRGERKLTSGGLHGKVVAIRGHVSPREVVMDWKWKELVRVLIAAIAGWLGQLFPFMQ